MLKILWVDPDQAYTSQLASSFGDFPKIIQHAVTKRNAMKELLIFQPECTILEIHLPDGSGLELCRKIRSYSYMPVIFFTFDLSSQTAIRAFEAGASDYVRKPCAPKELLYRVRKECAVSLKQEKEIKINNLIVQPKNRRVYLNGDQINLTPIEFNILLLLTEHVNQTIPIDVFYQKFWDNHALKETSRVLQAHITNLRRKLKFQKDCSIRITNLYGKGYGLSTDKC